MIFINTQPTRTYITFLLIFLFVIQAFTQRKLETKHDTVALMYYAKKSDLFLQKQSDSALFYANKGIEYSNKYNSDLGLLINMEQKAFYYEDVKNNYEAAAKIYFESITIAEKKEVGFLSGLYNNLSILFTSKGDYTKAELYAKKAVETSIKELGYLQEESALVNLGNVLNLQKKYNESTKTYNRALNLKKLPRYEVSNYYKRVKNDIYYKIGVNYKKQNKYKEAQKLFIKTIALDSLKGQREFNNNYMQLVKTSILLKNKKDVEKYLPLLNRSIENERSLETKKEAYKTLALVYNFLGNSKEAYEYQNKLLIATDSINTRLNKKQIAELETKYQTRKKEEQILEEQNQKQFWIYSAILAFIILIFVVVLLYKNSNKRKQLNANKIELEKLLDQRNMLLKETHHRVKNSFQMVSSLLQLQAQGSKAEIAVKALDNAVQRVNSMIVLHQQLYAKDNLLGVDLHIYINDLIDEILASYPSEGIQIKANVTSAVLDIDTTTSIGLLVNELATNSIKYAWGKNESEKVITLNIDVKDHEFNFKMFDNGNAKMTKFTKQNYGSELIEILIERLEADRKEFLEKDFGLNITFKKENG